MADFLSRSPFHLKSVQRGLIEEKSKEAAPPDSVDDSTILSCNGLKDRELGELHFRHFCNFRWAVS